MTGQQRWKVGQTQQVTYGPGGHYAHGFSIQDARGAPLLSLSFATKEDAKEAEDAMRAIVAKVVHIDKT